MRDDILEEVLAARSRICEQSGYDFTRMFDRFKSLQDRCPPQLLIREKVAKSELEEGLLASYNSPSYQESVYNENEIIDEVRAARAKVAAECGYDVKKLGERLTREQEEHPKVVNQS
jgi:hypothetical protein